MAMTSEAAVMRVYLLQHTHSVEGTEDVKFIGVYSARDNAQAAIARLRSASGFSETPEGFYIDEYQLDKYQWVEGYSSGFAKP
jgi:hypothetical protein